MVERLYYSEHVREFINKPLVKIITGIRRSGKSTMMQLVRNELLASGIEENRILYINFESMRFFDLRHSKDLYDYVMERCSAKGRYYLFFDEIQLVEEWERAVNSFLVDLDTDIYITGSNSQLLSSELSTLLTGRCIEIRLYPLSFKETIRFREVIPGLYPLTPEEQLWRYIRQGGFPAIHISEYEEDSAYMIINDTYDSVVLRDVVQRFSIRNIDLLNRIMKYVIDNTGNTFSAKSISDYFKSQYRKVDINTIYNYLTALESSFIVFRINRYDVLGKEILKTQEKFYLADQGIQHAVFGYRDRNISGILENIVFLELKRRGYNVYIGKLNDKEIDFIGEKAGEKVYIQVSYKLEEESTIEREFAPLLAIKDHYPKFVISMDEHFRDNIRGVRHIKLIDFLTSDT